MTDVKQSFDALFKKGEQVVLFTDPGNIISQVQQKPSFLFGCDPGKNR